jgi:nucleoside-diphosphate-sugar epimerase
MMENCKLQIENFKFQIGFWPKQIFNLQFMIFNLQFPLFLDVPPAISPPPVVSIVKRRRLIIGGGYLGRRVAKRWLAEGDTVSALTRSMEHAQELRRLGIEPIVGDVTEPASLSALRDADTLLFAVGLDRSSGKTQREVHVDGLGNVLLRIGKNIGRVILISSTSVYGQKGGEWVDESSECRPESPNGQVCLDAERLLHERFPAANILRLAGIYGPGRLIARVAELRAGLPLEGNPDAWLNLIHVDDAARAVLACSRQGKPGAIYVVADGNPIRRREYYSFLAALVGAPTPTMCQVDAELVNKRCTNRLLREELQVTLRYPTIRVGLPDALSMRDA